VFKAPDAPSTVDVSPGDAQVLVTWAAPADNGSPLISYLVSWRAVSGARAGSITVPARSLETTISGLANGTTYVVSVAARNQAGPGPGTQSPTFVPNPGLTAPADLQAMATSNGAVTVTWRSTARTTHGPVQFFVTAAGQTVAQTSRTRVVITGLTLGRPYRFTVAAADGSGQRRSATSEIVIPFSPAAAPGALRSSSGAGTVDLSWTPPAVNGGTLAGYLVSANGEPDQTVTGPSATFTGLHTSTLYKFSVRAITHDPNGGGTSLTGASATISARPITVPAVTIVDAAWTENNDISIQVTVDDGGGPTTCVTTTVIISFSNGPCDSEHSIVIRGINSDGDIDVPLQVTGTNAAGKGQPSNTFLLKARSSGGHHDSVDSNSVGIPPARVHQHPRVQAEP
jgi:hypothetical protein